MTDPGPRDPESVAVPSPADGLAFPPLGIPPDPGPLGRAGSAPAQSRTPGPRQLPPPRPLPARPPRQARRGASSARRLALLVTLLAIVGAGLTIAARDGLADWRLATGRSAEQVATARPGQPPTPIAALAVLSRDGDASGVREAAPAGGAAWERRLRQLTTDGCCAGSWWSSDSASLRYVDRPDGSPQSVVYVLPIWPPGSLAAVFDGAPAPTDGEPRFSARPEGRASVVSDAATGREWAVDTGGNPTLVAPDGSALVWYAAKGGRSDVDGYNGFFTAAVDGAEPRSIGGLWGGSVLRFLPDSSHVLALGREAEDSAVYSLQRIAVANGATELIASGLWLSDVALSNEGSWVAYMVSLDREHPAANGIWVAPTTSGGGQPVKLELPGAYRWRDDNRLVYIPQLPGAAGHALLQLDARQGRSTVLLDPASLAIHVAGNDWSVSPDGRHLAFRAEEDRCLWLLELPE